MPDEATTTVAMTRIATRSRTAESDRVAVEEPLEILLAWTADDGPREKVVAVTMRTPGDDLDLAAGFLFTEGLLKGSDAIESIRQWGGPNVVRVSLRPGSRLDAARLERHFYTTSSCGVCGKTSIDAIRMTIPPLSPRPPLREDLVHALPSLLQRDQRGFHATGGLHAAAIVSRDGQLLTLREDVGRHNALDKAIGAHVRGGTVPMPDAVVMVSSRASFELVQKALVAGIPVLAAAGAPSSLAIELAQQSGMTLLAFVRDGRFNVYSGSVESN